MKAATGILAGMAVGASAATLERGGAEAIPGQYIIRLSERFDGQMIKNHVNKVKAVLGDSFQPRHVYDELAQYGFSAYSADLKAEALSFLLEHAEVVRIEEDQTVIVI